MTTITRSGGGTFSVTSLEVANLDNSGPVDVQSGSGYRIEVFGDTAGDDVYGPGSSSFTTETPTDLTNISELFVNIVSRSGEVATFAVDDIALSSTAAPEPASLAIMAAAIAGLGAVVRGRRA